ncbi:MAG TPA: SAM-dependent methyltransferase [Chitinophagales bacterium]
MQKGKLYLIPTFLSETDSNTILPHNVEIVKTLNHFVVENLRTARRHLRAMGYTKNFDTEVTMYEWDKHKGNPIHSWLAVCESGASIGFLSESGTPCIADPGNLVVKEAYRKNIQVVPLVGANSILLALMASGFNGQKFSFTGYLPIQSAEKIAAIKQLESTARKTGYTQLFMETPFRNTALINDLLKHLHPDTFLHISCDLTLPTEVTATKKVSDWKKAVPDFGKRYCVFAISND